MLSNYLPLPTWRSSDESNHVITTLTGWLWKMKRGERVLVPQWNKRWCTIEGIHFKWYQNETSQCSGTILLGTVTKVKEYKSSLAGSFCFVITCPTRQMFLRASSQAEMDKWIRALLFQADLARGGRGTNVDLTSYRKPGSNQQAHSVSLEAELGRTLRKLNKLEKDFKQTSKNNYLNSTNASSDNLAKQQTPSKSGYITYSPNKLNSSFTNNTDDQKQLEEFYAKAFAEADSDSDSDINEEKDSHPLESSYEQHSKALSTSNSKSQNEKNSIANSDQVNSKSKIVNGSKIDFKKAVPRKSYSKDYDLESSQESVEGPAIVAPVGSRSPFRNTNSNGTKKPSAKSPHSSNNNNYQNNNNSSYNDETNDFIQQTQIQMIRENEFRQKLKMDSYEKELPLFDSDDDIPEYELKVVNKAASRRRNNGMTNANPDFSDEEEKTSSGKLKSFLKEQLPFDVRAKPALILGRSDDSDDTNNIYMKKNNPLTKISSSGNKLHHNSNSGNPCKEDSKDDYYNTVPTDHHQRNGASRHSSQNSKVNKKSWVDDEDD